MEFRIAPAAIVFLGSYLPLSIILVAQNFHYSALRSQFCDPIYGSNCALPFENAAATLGFAIICLLCMVFTIFVLSAVKPKHDIVITNFEYIPSDLMNYTLPYVVSFMNLNLGSIGNFFGFAVFLGWMFWISLRSGQIMLNPVLIALGWKHYSIEYNFAASAKLQTATCLSKTQLQTGSAKQTPIQSILMIEQKEK